MSSSYFSNFPIVTYGNNQAVDITERVIFRDKTLNNPYVFYPYDLTNDERADQFANRYYNDSYKSWILYLGNNITDPYYGWYLSKDQFDKFIQLKYNSISDAQQKIICYENNWYNSSNISVSDFDALPDSLVKYWNPVYGSYNNIIEYSRKESNNTITTNAINSYNVNSNTFIIDEICSINFDDNTIGKGQVKTISNNVLYLQHLSGYTNSNTNANSYIYGSESQTNSIFYNVSVIANALLPEEVVYWSPVSYYDYESNNNEFNKSIKVLDSDYATYATKSLQSLLGE